LKWPEGPNIERLHLFIQANERNGFQ
jgi:hypothetical protein